MNLFSPKNGLLLDVSEVPAVMIWLEIDFFYNENCFSKSMSLQALAPTVQFQLNLMIRLLMEIGLRQANGISYFNE